MNDESTSKMKLAKRGVRFGVLFALTLAVAGGGALLLTGSGGEQGPAAGAKEEQLYTCGCTRKSSNTTPATARSAA